jgi:hypothetical protein
MRELRIEMTENKFEVRFDVPMAGAMKNTVF